MSELDDLFNSFNVDDGVVHMDLQAAWPPDLEDPWVTPRPNLRDVVYMGAFHLVSGKPEAAKTWFAMWCAIPVLRDNGAIVFWDTDGNGQIPTLQRWLQFGVSEDALKNRVYYATDISQVEDQAEQLDRPTVLIIDTMNPALAQAADGDLTEKDMLALEKRIILPYKRAGAAIIGTDHIPKNKESDATYSIGTQRKAGASDVHLRLEVEGPPLSRNAGSSIDVKVRGIKDRPGGLVRPTEDKGVGELTIHVEDERRILTTWRGYHDDGLTEWGRRMKTVISWCSSRGGAFSKSEMSKDLGLRRSDAAAMVDQLYEEGRIRKDGRGYIWQGDNQGDLL